ncbi:metallopeptidase family protein [Corynebacterium cystitidis]|uniref:metallopeptidase family protein n=1 Tax=Corynebacterium cystitidis TaxID=35757 RepID=UPI0015A5193D|nr:metallopeptidase family protein [Corynebacterium cystitidis]
MSANHPPAGPSAPGVPEGPLHLRVRHDRHDRGLRGPLLPVAVPRYRTRSLRFDQAVLEAYAPLQNAYFDQLAGVDLAVDTVPRMRLRADMTVLPDDIVADGPVPLGRILQAGVDSQGLPTRARIVIFRAPVEQRCTNAYERAELLTWILTALIANYLNVSPEDIDSGFEY